MTRRIIEDISFTRFINELVAVVKKHPDALLDCPPECGDDHRAEGAFMFKAVLVYSEGEKP